MCDKEVPGVDKPNESKGDDKEKVATILEGICYECNEYSNDSALGIHFGDSDDDLMLNDNFDFDGNRDEGSSCE